MLLLLPFTTACVHDDPAPPAQPDPPTHSVETDRTTLSTPGNPWELTIYGKDAYKTHYGQGLRLWDPAGDKQGRALELWMWPEAPKLRGTQRLQATGWETIHRHAAITEPPLQSGRLLARCTHQLKSPDTDWCTMLLEKVEIRYTDEPLNLEMWQFAPLREPFAAGARDRADEIPHRFAWNGSEEAERDGSRLVWRSASHAPPDRLVSLFWKTPPDRGPSQAGTLDKVLDPMPPGNTGHEWHGTIALDGGTLEVRCTTLVPPPDSDASWCAEALQSLSLVSP